MVGLTLSVTTTSCVQVAVLPDPSVTVQVTVVVPRGYVVDGWLLPTLATLQLSAVTGVPSDTPVAVHPLLVNTLTVAGQVMVGFTLLATLATLQLSAVTGLPSDTSFSMIPLLVNSLLFPCPVLVRFTLSVTTTSCVQVAVLPDPSVTVQVTVVVPRGYVVDG